MRHAFPIVALVVLTTAIYASEPEVRVPDGHGGGDLPAPTDEMSPEERARIQAELDVNIAKLKERGILPMAPTAPPGLFTWPLRAAKGLIDAGYHGISNFVDQNPMYPGMLLDYECGSRTYDTSTGYNHSGTDIFTAPFWWRKMSLSQVEIVAAAPGTIIGRDDGFSDTSCSTSGGQWNAVYVQHDDGSIAWYGHMKRLSPTTKAIGARVERGEYLGVVGSSGNSTGPHLHLEIYGPAGGGLIDPYAGVCNALNATSWWKAQRPYYDSAISDLTTGLLQPGFPACPGIESPNEVTKFARGANIYFTAYYRDQLAGQTTNYTVRDPNGAVYAQWSHGSVTPHFAWSFWWWPLTNVAPNGPDGLWTFEAVYNGTTSIRTFNIGGAPAGRVPGDYGSEVPLTLSKAPGLVLTWAAGCVSGDSDYAIYEGQVGNWTSHVPVMCSTGGALSRTFAPGSGSRYYLVVVRNATREGSYGFDGTGAERPVSTAACFPQETGSCP
jgi:murein DD-endopeptidase MepM/ murein hydrolase activator NlpD